MREERSPVRCCRAVGLGWEEKLGTVRTILYFCYWCIIGYL